MDRVLASGSHDERLSFVQGVRRELAMDSRILLRAPDGQFVAVSHALGPLLDHLERGCRREQLRELIRSDPGDEGPDLALTGFLESLRRAGILHGHAQRLSRMDRLIARASTDFFLRRPLRIDVDRIARRLVGPLRGAPPSLLLAAALSLGVAGLVGGLTVVRPWQRGLMLPDAGWIIAVVAIVLAQLAVHELCHAIALRVRDIPVREIGVGLLYFFVPVAYVDRTEAYASRSRAGLALIALAGPVLDACLIGVASLTSLTTTAPLHDAVILYITLELFLLAANCNPLFRSDGYQALEAAFGVLNMRARAFRMVINGMLRRPQPGYIRTMPLAARAGMALYAVGSIAYLIALLTALCHAILVTVLPLPS